MALETKDAAAKWLEKGFLFHGTRQPLPVARWSASRVGINFTASSANVQLPADSDLIEIAATESCFINFGADNTVTASNNLVTSKLFIAGVQVIPVPINPATGQPYTWMAAIQVSTAGIIQAEKVI